MHLNGRNVVVLGLGLTGLSLARWLIGTARRFASPTRARCHRTPQALAAELPHVRPRGRSVLGVDVRGADMIAISPGVAKDQPAIRDAVAAGVELVGDVELFARALPAGQKVLAITGTNGKTTVTALAGELAHAAGLSTVVAGNIGKAVLDVLAQHEDGAAWPDVFVLELSSYPARNDVVAQADRGNGAERVAEPPRSLRRHRGLCGREGARFSRTRRCRCSTATTRSCG